MIEGRGHLGTIVCTALTHIVHVDVLVYIFVVAPISLIVHTNTANTANTPKV